jgi:nucleoside-diphosphate-sugar epimerase
MIKAAVVAGAEDFVGSHLVKVQQAKGRQVSGCYRLRGTNAVPKAEGCTSKGREFQKKKSAKSANARRSCSKVEIRHLIGRAL